MFQKLSAMHHICHVSIFTYSLEHTNILYPHKIKYSIHTADALVGFLSLSD